MHTTRVRAYYLFYQSTTVIRMHTTTYLVCIRARMLVLASTSCMHTPSSMHTNYYYYSRVEYELVRVLLEYSRTLVLLARVCMVLCILLASLVLVSSTSRTYARMYYA